MLKMKIMLATLLSVFAIGMASASSASASGFVIWGAEWCMRVPPGRGGFLTPNCWVAAPGGEYARAISWPNGLTFACLWIGVGFGMLADPGCIFLGPGWGFGVFADAPALTVTVKGGPYKFEGKVAGLSAKVTCKTMKAAEPSLESGGGADGGKAGMFAAKSLEFSECTTEAPEKCEISSVGAPSNTIDTKPVLGELVENATLTKVENVLKPQSGSKFAELLFKNGVCGSLTGTLAVEGQTLTYGGSEDLISNELKDLALGPLGSAGDDDLVEKAVEKYLLLSEPSSKKYLNDETGKDEEAKLTLAGSELMLLGEANLSGKLAKTTLTDSETSESVETEEESVDLGLDRE